MCVDDTLIILTGGILIPMLPTEKLDGTRFCAGVRHIILSVEILSPNWVAT
jgi:hypothetical protein